MQTHIQKWGNSLGLRIPIQLAKQLNSLQEVCNLEIENGKMIIQPPQYDLETMLKEITSKKSASSAS